MSIEQKRIVKDYSLLLASFETKTYLFHQPRRVEISKTRSNYSM